MTGLLPPDSSGLFQDGELQDHNFAQSSFTEDDIGTSVTECDLTNIDTSNVETMEGMFAGAESFNQDISAWCVEQITQKPTNFDKEAGFEGDNTKHPNWGGSESGGFLSSLLWTSPTDTHRVRESMRESGEFQLNRAGL